MVYKAKQETIIDNPHFEKRRAGEQICLNNNVSPCLLTYAPVQAIDMISLLDLCTADRFSTSIELADQRDPKFNCYKKKTHPHTT